MKQTLAAWGYEPGDIFELCAIDPGRGVSSRRFLSVEEAKEFVSAWNGQRNLYLGANPLKSTEGGRAKRADVRVQRTVLLDCDPATEGADVLSAVQRLVEWLGVVCPILFSGRGAQAWVPFSGDPEWAHRLVLACQAKAIEWELPVQVDATHDASRLMRLPGTINQKTRKEATWWSTVRGDPVELRADWPVPVKEKSVEAWSEDPPTCEELERWIVGSAKVIWDDSDFPDRSKRDARFVLALREAQCPADVCCRLLASLPLGKMNEDQRGADYFNATLAWADARCSGVWDLEELRDADDPEELLFDDDDRFLQALAKLDSKKYAKERKALKKKGVGLTQLDRLVKEFRSKDTKKVAADTDKLRLCYRDGREYAWYANNSRLGWKQLKGISSARLLAGDDEILRAHADEAFELVNIPFGEEYPAMGEWNLNGAKLAVEPAQGEHSTWDRMLEHLGQGLDEAVRDDPWCQEHGIDTGARYLLFWIAALLQYPDSKLPYLFLYSEEHDTGKSSLHESIARLLAEGRGAMDLKGNLTGQSVFNGELEGIIFGYLDEYDLSRQAGRAYNALKNWTMSDFFKCTYKGLTPFRARNRIRIIHTANNRNYCPLFPGDDRVIVIPCYKVPGDLKLGRDAFKRKIDHERSAFLWTVLREIVLPEHQGRQRLPILHTDAKTLVQQGNASMLAAWLEENPQWISWSIQHAMDKFLVESFGQGGGRGWSVASFKRALPDREAQIRRTAESLTRCVTEAVKLTAREIKALMKTKRSVKGLGHDLAAIQQRWPSLVTGRVRVKGVTQWILQPSSLSHAVA